MDNANYFLRRNIKCEDKIEALMLDMPYFCSEFFNATELRVRFKNFLPILIGN